MKEVSFTKTYLEPVCRKVVSGRCWYTFHLSSIRTCKELGILTDCGNNRIIEFENTKLVVDSIGKLVNLTQNGKTYYPKTCLPVRTFGVYLPIQNISAV